MEPRNTSYRSADYSFKEWLGSGALFMDDNHEIEWFPHKSSKEIYVNGRRWKRIGIRDFGKYASLELKKQFHDFSFLK